MAIASLRRARTALGRRHRQPAPRRARPVASPQRTLIESPMRCAFATPAAAGTAAGAGLTRIPCAHIMELSLWGGISMNITLSIDEKLAEQARLIAKSMGKSLNQLVRDHLEQLTRQDEAREEIAE
ncbi:MAG: DUF6364 family protein, partial [Gammaproteobacteria bacterium]